MFKLFQKTKPFFEGWEKKRETISPFIPEAGTVGNLKLGDRIESIQSLGKPVSFNQEEEDYYTLEYEDFIFESKSGFVTYIGCRLGKVQVSTEEGKSLDKGMGINQVMDELGAPDQDDVGDLDDVILTYTKNGIVIECEFGKRQELVRINCFSKEET